MSLWNRRAFCLVSIFIVALFLLAPVSVRAQGEPAYTFTLPDKQTLPLQLTVEKKSDGGVGRVRVQNRPSASGAALVALDLLLTTDGENKPTRCRVSVGARPDDLNHMEAIRTEKGEYDIQVPAEKGELPLGARLFSPLAAELFVGRMYDLRRGGPQNFALLIDYGPGPVKVITLTLTAEGPEQITLPDGPVKARRMRYKAAVPFLPKEQQAGVFWIGPLGEVLKCDTSFFGVPLRAKKPAFYENNGKRLTLTFSNPDSPDTLVHLRADRRTSGLAVTLSINDTPPFANLECDPSFQPLRIETAWKGRPFKAEVNGSALRYVLEGVKDRVHPVSSGRVWFPPYWFVTELWEGEKGAFANLKVGETRDGDYLPLLLGPREGQSFSLERLADKTTSAPSGEEMVVRRYRFSNKPGSNLSAEARNVYDLYTDGSRLIAFVGSDGITITRDGWGAFTGTLKKPDPAPIPRQPAKEPE